MSNITTPTALALQLADAYANACFEQGLNQRTEDPAPESAREKLAANLAQIDNHVTEINRLRNVIQAACLGGTDLMIERWTQLFPDAPVPSVQPVTAANFQGRVQPWMLACFGAEISADKVERNHRFLEEALELVQATGCTQSEAHQLVDYVFGRPVGEPVQEAGGVMVTLAALCLAHELDMHTAAETELARIWTKVDAIRAKQAAKPKHSPLPA